MLPIEKSIVKFAKKNQIPGYSIQLIDDYKLADSFIFGTTIANGQSDITSKTLFQPCSISKTLVAVVVLHLARKHIIRMDENVNRYLKGWSLQSKTPVNVRQLLNHTGGISCSGFYGYDSDSKKLPTTLEILDGMPPANSERIFQKYKPGRYRYSGGGYIILQKILEQKTRENWNSLAERIVFKTLKMTNSTYRIIYPHNQSNMACGHDAEGKLIKGFWRVFPESATAGLWSTPTDIAKLVIEIMSALHGRGKILTAESARQLLKTSAPSGAGLGTFVHKTRSGIEFSHSGGNVGYKSRYTAFDNGKGAVIMTNSETGRAFIKDSLHVLGKTYGWGRFKVEL